MGSNKRVHAFSDDALGRLDAVGVSKLIAAGDIHPKEVVEAAISRAEKVNPQLNAIVIDSFEHARAQAIQQLPGAFSGIPTFIKDTDDVKELPTRVGSRATSPKLARKNSAFVTHTNKLGFINLGKSTTPEFGLTATTESSANGPTCNPWNTAHSTGGSSGGAAALVASGVVPIAHGNDGGGSIRIPASCCGVVGLKPTRNRLPNVDGSTLLPLNIVYQGVITRSVRDTAAFYAAAEQVYCKSQLPKVGHVLNPGKKRLRIALIKDAGPASLHEDSLNAVEQAAKLCESLGHHIEEIAFPYDEELADDFLLHWAFMAFSCKNLGAFLFGKGFDKHKLEAHTNALSQHFSCSMLRYPFAIRRLIKFAAEYETLFENYDLLLSPTLAEPPPILGYLSPEQDPTIGFERVFNYVPFTPAQNVSGAPAISLPMAMSKGGLPIGIQFAGAHGQERQLLELALELEEAQPWALITND